jgi:hypothetical protein
MRAIPQKIIVAIAVVAVSFFVASGAQCSTIEVTTPLDGSFLYECTLRDAIAAVNRQTSVEACAGAGADTIDLSHIGSIILKGGPLPYIKRSVTINGDASTKTAIVGGPFQFIMLIHGGNIVLRNLSLQHANSAYPGSALSISGSAAGVILESCDFVDNRSSAISDFEAPLIIRHASFSGNSFVQNVHVYTPAGAIEASSAPIEISDSSFLGNTADGGSAIYVHHGTLVIKNSFFSQNVNHHQGLGGAISAEGANVVVINSTFNQNTGGAIFLNRCAAFIGNSTQVDNTSFDSKVAALQNFDNRSGSVVVRNTIISESPNGELPGLASSIGAELPKDMQKGTSCAGPITSFGFNTSSDTSCGFGTTAGALGQTLGDNVTVAIAAPSQNGGPTATMALTQNSVAVDAIAADACVDQNGQNLTVDQRGYTRPAPLPQNPLLCDIGAYEFGAKP